MRNLYLRERIAAQIDSQVERILREIDCKEPPLRLEDVRAHLKLDLQYYTANDPGFIQEVVHRAKLGMHEIAQTAMNFLQAVKRWDLKAAFFPESKRICIDKDSPTPKWRWSEGHEIIHSILPWHQPLMFADSRLTLSQDCAMKMEAEANFGCGRLLTLQDMFREEVLSSPLTWDLLKQLGKRYNNTLTSTLWRAIEVQVKPTFGLVGFHPYHFMEGSDSGVPCKYFVGSKDFNDQFPDITEQEAVDIFESYCKRSKGGPLGGKNVCLRDANGEEHEFRFDSFSNMHETLTLVTYIGKRQVIVSPFGMNSAFDRDRS